MTEPEIARRCLSCGASVRQRASFCPQCGQLLAHDRSGPESDAHAESIEDVESGMDAETAPDVEPVTPELPPDTSMTQPIIMTEDARRSFPAVAETQPLVTRTIPREPTVSESDRITPIAGDGSRVAPEHHLMERVDRLRKVSSVVIDQAAYDPSLRFVLVAAVLFIIFVILMVLSKVIG